MLSVAKHLLFLLKKSRSFASLCRNSTRNYFRINNMLKHDWRQVLPIMGSPEAVNAQDDTIISLLVQSML